MLILIGFSLLSGLVTVLSPCILPVLPIVLSTSAARGRSRPLGVILGLIASFSFFTLAVATLVSRLGISASALRLVAVAIIGVLGLGMLVPALTSLFERALAWLPGLAPQETEQRSGFLPGLLTGASLGLVWAPCAGPILAAITTLAATQSVTIRLVWVTLAYAFGAGIPLLAIAYGGRAAFRRLFARVTNPLRVQQVFGVVMILTAGLIAFNADTLVTAWATALAPAGWTSSLQSFESSAPVSQQITDLTGKDGVDNRAPQPTQPVALIPATGGGNAGASTPLDLAVIEPAPEITGITQWINSQPLTIKELRGKVVLIDFWTYSCINCIRTLPYVTDWYQKYKDQGFVVIGVHSPEFAFEHETSNVEAAVKRFGITYPVAQDNDFATWNAYHNEYWPAEYLIDAQGNIRHMQFGEGNYDESQKAIEQLLAEAGHSSHAALTSAPAVQFSPMQSPETYLGTNRLERSTTPQAIAAGEDHGYEMPMSLGLNQFAVGGIWNFQGEYAVETASPSSLKMRFFAKDVYLVMTSSEPVTVTVKLTQTQQANESEDLNANSQITIREARLYHLVRLGYSDNGVVTLTFDQPGVEVYAFTFGG